LGDHVFTNFIASKKVEWDEYRTDVSRWEIEKYLPLL
ncbi:MAG: Glutamine synthase, partial [Methanothrix harundinacea]